MSSATNRSSLLILFVFILFASIFILPEFYDVYSDQSQDPQNVCVPIPMKNTYGKATVYANTPYKSGENIKYAVTFMGIFAGYGELNVLPPLKLKDSWVRHFEAQGVTGDWFKSIAFAKAKTESLVDPISQRGLQVNMVQETKKLFSDRKIEKRWLDINHDICSAHNKKIKSVNGEESVSESDYFAVSGTFDVLGATYWLREQKLEIGKELKVPVYSSKTNWLFKLTPVQEEEIKTPLRTFKTLKLKLDTVMGEQFEQKGDTFAWISIDTLERPIVQVQATLKIGSVKLVLEKYTKKKL